MLNIFDLVILDVKAFLCNINNPFNNLNIKKNIYLFPNLDSSILIYKLNITVMNDSFKNSIIRVNYF